ncbi:hypothetical protein [Prauserella cavernicola]|uniref:Uncharacterized protein n=1 Tax=Prauserella cavernicola TaxID=2800127 RepID=A0A934QZ63_9PSEU|nr:hypothetical protein [Prauserella cavernicola]MBK1787958.1 hypothetical protein [Prauserella cavernicola]
MSLASRSDWTTSQRILVIGGAIGVVLSVVGAIVSLYTAGTSQAFLFFAIPYPLSVLATVIGKRSREKRLQAAGFRASGLRWLH